MRLLERERDLQELGHLLDQTRAGHGRLVLLSGEAGIGKTSLVREFSRVVDGRAEIHSGARDPLDTPRPLGPVLDMAPTLGRELEELVNAGDQRHRVLQAFLIALGHGRRPKLVVIEDVHWADEATLDLLRFIGRRIEQVQALVLITYRDDEVGQNHPLTVVLGDIATSPAVHRMRLPSLSEAAVRELATDSGVDPVALHRRTSGNPFYVTEVLAAGNDGIPVTVRDAVLARAGRLSRSARSVLDAAAIIGPVIPAWLLVEVTQADADTVDECLSIGVLASHGEGFMFRHELGREAILDALPDFRRIDLHGVVLEALERSGATENADGLAQLAHHAEGARNADAVLKYAPAAARRAVTLHAHREAAAQYARALRWSDALEPGERADLLELYAAESSRNDQLDEAIRARTAAIEIRIATGDTVGHGRNLIHLASALGGAGRNAEAHARSREAIRVLESVLPSPELAQAYRGEAHLRMLNRDTADAVDWGGKAIDLAQKFGDQTTLIGAEQSIGAALLVAGDHRGVEYLMRALERSRAVGNDDLEALTLGNLGSGLGEMYDFDQAVYWLEQSIQFSEQRDHDRHLWYSKSWLALSLMYTGAWDRAGSIANEVVHRPYVSTISLIMATVALGRLRTRRGDPEVWSTLDRALDLAIQTDTLQRLAPVRAARAEAAWLDGDLGRARAEAEANYDLALSPHHHWFTGELAYWQWKAGVDVDLPEWAAEPFALQIRGDWQAAADLWQDIGCPYETARALAESSDEGALREALRIFGDLGARPMFTIVQSKLRELGVRNIPRGPRPATKANPAGLTPRESEVLELLAEGLSNPEIAGRLFLSPRTVEHHVSSILAKLDARSRVEAIQVAKRLSTTS
jgi:DNA-binding CsgD family transcriptional regulator/tetratricopeptide (TPR) repeat protein